MRTKRHFDILARATPRRRHPERRGDDRFCESRPGRHPAVVSRPASQTPSIPCTAIHARPKKRSRQPICFQCDARHFERVRNSLRTNDFNSVRFQIHAHTFPGSPVICAFYELGTGGIYTSPLPTHSPLAEILRGHRLTLIKSVAYALPLHLLTFRATAAIAASVSCRAACAPYFRLEMSFVQNNTFAPRSIQNSASLAFTATATFFPCAWIARTSRRATSATFG